MSRLRNHPPRRLKVGLPVSTEQRNRKAQSALSVFQILTSGCLTPLSPPRQDSFSRQQVKDGGGRGIARLDQRGQEPDGNESRGHVGFLCERVSFWHITLNPHIHSEMMNFFCFIILTQEMVQLPLILIKIHTLLITRIKNIVQPPSLHQNVIVFTHYAFNPRYLLPSKSKSTKRKTPVVKKTLNPHYDHTFVYKDLTLDQLSKMCLELTVWDREAISSNDFLGGVRLGTGNDTTPC